MVPKFLRSQFLNRHATCDLWRQISWHETKPQKAIICGFFLCLSAYIPGSAGFCPSSAAFLFILRCLYNLNSCTSVFSTPPATKQLQPECGFKPRTHWNPSFFKSHNHHPINVGCFPPPSFYTNFQVFPRRHPNDLISQWLDGLGLAGLKMSISKIIKNHQLR